MAQTESEVKTDTLAEYDDDTLAEMADALGREADRLFRLARGAHEELRARLIERGATKLDTDHWEGTLKPGSINHTIDDLCRFKERLGPWVGHDELDAAFVQPPAPSIRADHRILNDLHKLGGQVAAIIDEERRSVRGEPSLLLTRKMEADPI